MNSQRAIEPGATLGVVGGGQLGRMFGYVARRQGYGFVVLDPDPDCPAAAVADRVFAAPYDDVETARAMARSCDVLTVEFENVPADTLAALESLLPVRPSAHVLATCRHRVREKAALVEFGVPVAPYRAIRSAEEAEAAARELAGPTIVKSAEFGYDGKGQARAATSADARAAFEAVGAPECVIERVVSFDRELSVIVARRPSGEVRTYPVFENVHANHVLDVTSLPAQIPAEVEARAAELGRTIADRLDVFGLLTVELFQAGDELYVNELAPRPHNSGHVTIEACVTSQFENHLRAVCDLPLGDTSLRGPAAMANLLGDLWSEGPPAFRAAQGDPGVAVHLYGKREARPGRKMGHLTASDSSAEAAVARVRLAREALSRVDSRAEARAPHS